jgi:hypothetical protein
MMTERLSRAKTLQNFIDKIRFSKEHNGHSLLAVIANSFDPRLSDPQLRLLLRSQEENVERLLLEIEFSSIEPPAKAGYKRQVGELGKIFQFPALGQQAAVVRQDIIGPNYLVLPYLSDALKIYFDIEEADKSDLDRIASELDELSQKIATSDIDIQLRVLVSSSLNNLVLLIKNYKILGFEKASEAASGAILALYKACAKAELKDIKFLNKATATVLILVGILTPVDEVLKRSTSIGTQLKSAYDFVQNAMQENVLKIEHKKDDQP